MRRRLMIGRYVAGDSRLHRLDPRAKIVSLPLFMAAVFLVDTYAAAGVLALFTALLIGMTGIPFRSFARAVKPLMFLLLFIFSFHLLVEDGGSRYLQLGTFAFYTGGLERGVVAASRMILFIIYAAMLTFTTQPDRLAQGLSSVLTPLSLLGVPIPRLTLMLGIALRFVPTLFEEAERLWKAQVSRGLDLRRQPLARRARLLAALLIPVSTGAFRRAMALADAMESRGYRLDMPRTAYRSLGWQAADSWFLVLFALPVAAAAML